MVELTFIFNKGLPIRSGNYLVYLTSRRFEVLNYSERWKAWNVYDVEKDTKNKLNQYVIMWAELPQEII